MRQAEHEEERRLEDTQSRGTLTVFGNKMVPVYLHKLVRYAHPVNYMKFMLCPLEQPNGGKSLLFFYACTLQKWRCCPRLSVRGCFVDPRQ